VNKDQKINETGIKILIQGNKAVYEHHLEGAG